MAAVNKNKKATALTETQARWLNGEWLLGTTHAARSVEDTVSALALLAGIGAEALWQAHGNPVTHFWRSGMNQPISISDLEHHEACWIESGEGDNDPYGGDPFFVWNFYSDPAKQVLWDKFGDKDNFHWESVLRRPIPLGASVDAAMVAFADPLKPVCF